VRGTSGWPLSRGTAVTTGLVLAGALAAATAFALAPGHPARPGSTAAVHGLPPALKPAFTPGTPRALRSDPYRSRWAPVRRRVAARRAARTDASVVARLSTRTPEGTANLVVIVEHRQDRAGFVWARVRLPVLPSGSTGWVPRSALGGYASVDTDLDVDLERLRATLYRAGRPVFRADIGIGVARAPTPRGRFYVRNRLTRYASPTYGPVAFGTSARSETLTDWPGGGFVGIHGTDHPELLPGRVSHGCIRMRNDDIVELARLMPVGTPVTIR
jgi:lipoprotein-anchoring transpeptidase ErfK/SrfK